jgi:hypothetical protein
MLPAVSETMAKDAVHDCQQSQELNSEDGIHQIETPQKDATI